MARGRPPHDGSDEEADEDCLEEHADPSAAPDGESVLPDGEGVASNEAGENVMSC